MAKPKYTTKYKSPNIDIKKIGTFLKSVDGAEYLYMRHCMGMRDNIQELIKRHKLSRLDFCERFHINPKKYSDYIKGNYNYSMNDMAALNASFMELECEKLKENAPVKVCKE